MKSLKFLLFVVGCIFTGQTFAGVAVSKTPVDEDGNVFWTVDFTGNDHFDSARVEVNFLPTFDRTTFIHNARISGFDYSSRTGFSCSFQEFISRTNSHLGINKQASANLMARTKGNSKFSDKLIITVNNSVCTEFENGEEGASPSVDGSVFTGIRDSYAPDPYPAQRNATYTHEAHFNSEPGTSKGSLVLSANGYSRILTLTYKNGEVFSCAIPVGSPMDDFVLATKPHDVLKGAVYNVRMDISGYAAGRCAFFTFKQDSRVLP